MHARGEWRATARRDDDAIGANSDGSAEDGAHVLGVGDAVEQDDERACAGAACYGTKVGRFEVAQAHEDALVDAERGEFVQAGGFDGFDGEVLPGGFFDEGENAVVMGAFEVEDPLCDSGLQRHRAWVNTEREVVGGGVGLGAHAGHGGRVSDAVLGARD